MSLLQQSKKTKETGTISREASISACFGPARFCATGLQGQAAQKKTRRSSGTRRTAFATCLTRRSCFGSRTCSRSLRKSCASKRGRRFKASQKRCAATYWATLFTTRRSAGGSRRQFSTTHCATRGRADGSSWKCRGSKTASEAAQQPEQKTKPSSTSNAIQHTSSLVLQISVSV